MRPSTYMLLAGAVAFACGRPPGGSAKAAMSPPGASGAAVLSDPDSKLLLPILRSFEPGDAYAEAGVHAAVSDGVGAFLAQVTTTPEGTMRIDYVLRCGSTSCSADAPNWSALARDQAFGAAWQNLKSGLRVSALHEGNAAFFSVDHSSGLPAAAVALPDFHHQASQWIGGPVVFVAIPDSATLLVASPGSAGAAKLEKTVADWDGSSGPAYLKPTCYLLTKTGLKAIRRAKPAA